MGGGALLTPHHDKLECLSMSVTSTNPIFANEAGACPSGAPLKDTTLRIGYQPYLQGECNNKGEPNVVNGANYLDDVTEICA